MSTLLRHTYLNIPIDIPYKKLTIRKLAFTKFDKTKNSIDLYCFSVHKCRLFVIHVVFSVKCFIKAVSLKHSFSQQEHIRTYIAKELCTASRYGGSREKEEEKKFNRFSCHKSNKDVSKRISS